MATPHVDLPWDQVLPHAYAAAGGSTAAGSFDRELWLIGQAIHEAAERYGLTAKAVAEQLGHGTPVAETMRGSIDRAARVVVILDGSSEAMEDLFAGNRDDATDEIHEWFYEVWNRELEAAAERHGVSADAVNARLETEAEGVSLRRQIDLAARAVAADEDMA
jgi:hypothetical protein